MAFSDSVDVRHWPYFNLATPDAGGGYDYDGDNAYTPAGGLVDDAHVWLESGGTIGKDGALVACVEGRECEGGDGIRIGYGGCEREGRLSSKHIYGDGVILAAGRVLFGLHREGDVKDFSQLGQTCRDIDGDLSGGCRHRGGCGCAQLCHPDFVDVTGGVIPVGYCHTVGQRDGNIRDARNGDPVDTNSVGYYLDKLLVSITTIDIGAFRHSRWKHSCGLGEKHRSACHKTDCPEQNFYQMFHGIILSKVCSLRD
ncbi:hypothetical protein ES703_117962 [subsurface metagenome]